MVGTMNRKGAITFFFVALGVAVALGVFLYNMQQAQPHVEYTGETADQILKTINAHQSAFLYLDTATHPAMQEASNNLFRNTGYATTTARSNDCEELIHPVLEGDCEWNTKERLNKEFNTQFQDRANQNPYTKGQVLTFDTQIRQAGDDYAFTVESTEEIPLRIQDAIGRIGEASQPSTGRTVFNEQLVPIQGFEHITCERSVSCTGYPRNCLIKPEVYNQLREVDNYLDQYQDQYGFKMRITQATRSWEIQKAFWDQYSFCTNYKQDNCANPDTAACNQTYLNRVQTLEAQGRTFCAPKALCTPACNPGSRDNPNQGCTHMTGNAVDIELKATVDEQRITVDDTPRYYPSLKRTMCNLGFVSVAGEEWHYEYKSPQWNNIYEDGYCEYGSNGRRTYEEAEPLHIALGGNT